MTWTRDRPTEAGYYWARNEWGFPPGHVRVVKIRSPGDAGFYDGHQEGGGIEWGGSIPEPEGPPPGRHGARKSDCAINN